MARKAMRAAKPLGWMALGAALASLWILGPRIAVNRALDAGYSLAAWAALAGSTMPLGRVGSAGCWAWNRAL